MTIKELYNKVYTTDETKSSDQFIRLYEENKFLIENQEITEDENHEAVMRLTADFAHHLVTKESYLKALTYLDKAIVLFENYNGFDLSKMNDVAFYRILRFDRGVANFELRNYSKSHYDFKWLMKNNPDNETFRNWNNAIVYRKIQIQIRFLWYLLAGLLILEIFIDRTTFNILHTTVLILCSLSLLSILFLEAIKYKNKRKTYN